MARYHLNLSNGTGYVPDEEGGDFADLGKARSRAVDSIRSILSDEVSRGSLDFRGRIDIVDGDGVCLLTVRFSEAVDLHVDRARM